MKSAKKMLDKVPAENMLNAEYPMDYGNSAYVKAHNERYMNMRSGDMDKVMGHASPVRYIDPQPNYDIDRVKVRPDGYANTPKQAFEYQY